MAFGRRTGATAAAILPAALAGAALVAAPFAGTTTAPLAKSTATTTHLTAGHTTAAQSVHDGMPMNVPVGSIVTLVVAETALVGVGAGVIVVARRRRLQLAED
jgi:hypothetical protein